MSKRVVVAVEVDSSFVRLLNAEVGLSRLRQRGELTASQVLALAVLAEAKGGFPEEVGELIPREWKPSIRILHDERRVTEITPTEGDDRG